MAALFTSSKFSATDASGNPLAGGKVYTYSAGTLTPKATFTTQAGNVANANPVILDSTGRADIWLGSGAYKFVVTDSADVAAPDGTVDNVTAPVNEIVADLASTSIATKGAGMIGYNRDLPYPVNTVGRAIQGTVSIFEFMTDAQIADVKARTVSVDVSAAIQAAIDAFAGASAYDPALTTRIYFPDGWYRIDTGLEGYSGLHFVGQGKGTIIWAHSSVTTQALELVGVGGTDSVNFVTIQDIGFRTRGTAWAIKISSGNATEVNIKRLFLDCTYGLCAEEYMQSCDIAGIYSTGPAEQILRWAGNLNEIRDITAEQTAGTSTEPMVHIVGHALGKSNGNTLRRILIENTGSVNKTALRLEDCENTTLEGYWMEWAFSNGFGMEVINCTSVRFEKFYQGVLSGFKLKVRTSGDVWLDMFNTDSESGPLPDFIDTDATSRIRIGRLYTRNGSGTYPLSLLASGLHIEETYNRTAPTLAGYMPSSRLQFHGGNILTNPSFEAGIYGWDVSTMGAYTVALSQSEVGQGLMARFTWGSATTGYLYQSVAISSAQVGRALTFTAMVRKAGVGTVSPLAFDAGITATSGLAFAGGTGWEVITQTVVPQSAGTLKLGFFFDGCTDVYVDEACLSFGTAARVNGSEFGTLQLGGRTVGYGTAAPTVGTWLAGSQIFNSAPAGGQPKGWVCTVAGTPGTWASTGNL